jgi:hypothetical protein
VDSAGQVGGYNSRTTSVPESLSDFSSPWNKNTFKTQPARKKLKDRMATREGGSELEPVKILLKEPGLYPSQNPFTHKRWIESRTNRQDHEVMDQPLALGTIP